MAIVNLKSTVITNRDATPAVISDSRVAKGNYKSAFGFVTVGAADSAASVYRLVQVPTNAVVRGILASAPAGMNTLAGDVGVYRNTVDGSAVVDADFFASAQSFATVLSRADVTNESTTYTAAKMEQPIWQAVGLSADPGGTLDICVTVTTANTGVAGSLALEVVYVDGGN